MRNREAWLVVGLENPVNEANQPGDFAPHFGLELLWVAVEWQEGAKWTRNPSSPKKLKTGRAEGRPGWPGDPEEGVEGEGAGAQPEGHWATA